MLKRILSWLGIALLLFIGLLLFNTFNSKPWPVKAADQQLQPMPDSAIHHLSRAVQIPTISINDSAAIDTASFRSFELFLQQSYPLVHTHLSKTMIDQFSYVFEWKGQDANLPPIVLMGHYDAVPVEASVLNKWLVPPFSGKITDSCVWGRGAVDDKAGVISILEAAEAMLRKNFVPKRTLYLCFGHNEEISGQSAKAVVQYLESKNVRAEMVLDEGGEITETKIKEVKRPVAAIGVAEKGYASFELSVEKEGGHSMMPGKETAIDILSKGLYNLRATTTPIRLTPPVKELLKRIGRSSDNFVSRMAANNMWLFEGIAKSKMAEKPEGNAMMRTTLVPTILESGIKDNVIPSRARAIVNTRILPGETSASVEAYIRRTIDDDRIQIRKIGKYDSEPSPVTSVESPAFKRVESAVYRTVPNVLPTPYLGIGATDSRYYRRISDGVVNFLPLTDSKGYHGINERLPLRDLQRAIHFMMAIIEESNKEFK